MQKAEGGNFHHPLAEAVLQLLMEVNDDGLVGASRLDRSAEWTSCRNGYRDWSLVLTSVLCCCASPDCARLALSELPGTTHDQRKWLGGRYPGSQDHRHLDPACG